MILGAGENPVSASVEDEDPDPLPNVGGLKLKKSPTPSPTEGSTYVAPSPTPSTKAERKIAEESLQRYGLPHDVMVAREDTPGRKRLVVYVVTEAPAQALKAHIAIATVHVTVTSVPRHTRPASCPKNRALAPVSLGAQRRARVAVDEGRFEHEIVPGVVQSIKVVTEAASRLRSIGRGGGARPVEAAARSGLQR